MSIEANIKKIIKDIEKDPDLSEKLRMQSVEAIYAGPGSPEWERYMKHFASNEVELARLTGVRDVPCLENAPYAKAARAYLIANGTCGTPTYKRFNEGVGNNLDRTLPPSLPDVSDETDPSASTKAQSGRDS